MKTEIIEKIYKITGREFVFTDEESIILNSRDETEDLFFRPDVVIKPGNAIQICKIIKIANELKIPVTPRGGGTGLSGGALPIYGGIVLVMDRFNKIIEIDTKNFQVVSEPGVVTQTLQEECEKMNMFYPVDPASRGSCFIGGNIAECCGGPRAVKYGVAKEYVLGLEFVTPTGELITTGARTIKNVTGYNLSQLLTGSEGTLGIITKITLKLLPLPKFKKVILIAYSDVEKCISSVSEIFHYGITPSALEFMEKDAIKAAEEQLSKPFPNSDAEAQLLVELDGNYMESIEKDIEKIAALSEKFGAYDIILAEDRQKMEDIWALRRSVGEAVKSICPYKEEDTVVPRANLPKLLSGIKQITKQTGVRAICYGHAGDGNLHVNLLKMKFNDEEWIVKSDFTINEIFKLTISLGGTISGEHGIGYSQKKYLHLAISENELELFKKIKKSWDPNNILNPGKIFDL